MIVVFIVLMILSSVALGMLSLGEQDRIIKHLGLSAMNIFGLLLAMFVGVALVHEELERKTIYTLTASGVARYQFLLGKFFGLTLTIFANIALMTVLLTIIILIIPEASITASIYQAAFLGLFEMMLIIAIAILFSVLTSPVMAMVLTLMMYVIGHLSSSLKAFSQQIAEEGHIVASKILAVIYYVLPHLEVFNLKDEIVYGDVLDFRVLYMGYGLVYTAFLLCLASLIFCRKDFR